MRSRDAKDIGDTGGDVESTVGTQILFIAARALISAIDLIMAPMRQVVALCKRVKLALGRRMKIGGE